jgi:hypothetical protein
MDERGIPIPEEIEAHWTWEEIPVERASIYLGFPIRVNKNDCALHGKYPTVRPN